MSCPFAASCIAPKCRPGGRRWVAKSSTHADVEAFKADVVAYMQMTGETAVGRACAKVFRLAMKDVERECILS